MKVLALMGTYHKSGSTEMLVDRVLKGAEEAGADTEKVFLKDLEIQYCRNCLACWQDPELKLGKCPIDDDVASVLQKMTEADGLVLATPINYKFATGVTKVFMERMGPFCREKGKGPDFIAKIPVQRLSPEDRPVKGVAVVLCYGSILISFPGNKMLRDMFKLANVKKVEKVTCAWQYGNIFPLSKRKRLMLKAERAGRWLATS